MAFFVVAVVVAEGDTQVEEEGSNDDRSRAKALQSDHGAQSVRQECEEDEAIDGSAGPDARADVQPGLLPPVGRRSSEEQPVGHEDPEQQSEVSSDAGEADPGSAEALIGEILEHLPEEKRERLAELVYTLTTFSAAWSGWLPPPEDFNRFDPETRERMRRWNDAGTVDESKRQDMLVEAEIEQARAGPNRALVVVVICLALAGFAGLGQGNTILAALFLSPPLIMFAQTLISTVRSGSSRRRDDE